MKKPAKRAKGSGAKIVKGLKQALKHAKGKNPNVRVTVIKPPHRPSDYSDKIADEFCLRVAQGRSVANVCQDEDMPAQTTFYRWRLDRSEFREKFARAREARGENLDDQILALSLGIVNNATTGAQADPAKVRAAVDGIDRVAGRVNYRRVEVVGRGGGPVESVNLTGFTEKELDEYDRLTRKRLDGRA